jgi:dienelactone hydrolase
VRQRPLREYRGVVVKMSGGFSRWVLLGLLLFVGSQCSGTRPSQPALFISGSGGVRIEAFVYRPKAAGRHPVLIFNHGSAGGDLQKSFPEADLAEVFVAQGYVVVVPMRRGRGNSSGVSLESETKNCDVRSWRSGIESSLDDVTSVLSFVAKQPDVDPDRIFLAGTSRGGFLSVAYAAEGKLRNQVKGVVNFVGSWVAQTEDKCTEDFNKIAFARYGTEAKVTMLWLYGKGDRFNDETSTKSYYEAFSRSGGHATFHLIAGVPENGHWLSRYPTLWTKFATNYLAAQK